MAQERGNLKLHRVEDAVEIHVDHLVPVVQCLLGQWHTVAADARVVHGQMQPTKVSFYLVDNLLHTNHIAHVDLPGAHIAACRVELMAQGASFFPVNVEQRNTGSALQKKRCN